MMVQNRAKTSFRG